MILKYFIAFKDMQLKDLNKVVYNMRLGKINFIFLLKDKHLLHFHLYILFALIYTRYFFQAEFNSFENKILMFSKCNHLKLS